MQLKDEKVSENKKLRRLENQKFTRLRRRQRRPGVGGPLRYADGRRSSFLLLTFPPSHFLALYLLTFLFLKLPFDLRIHMNGDTAEIPHTLKQTTLHRLCNLVPL